MPERSGSATSLAGLYIFKITANKSPRATMHCVMLIEWAHPNKYVPSLFSLNITLVLTIHMNNETPEITEVCEDGRHNYHCYRNVVNPSNKGVADFRP